MSKSGLLRFVLAASALTFAWGHAQATTYDLSLAGQVANFSGPSSCGALCQDFYLPLTGLDSTNSITVHQGDIVDVTVALDQSYTIPNSTGYTNILLYLMGSSFPAENTGVSGTFNFYNGGVTVETLPYISTTSSQLSSYAVAPPGNPFTFDSFTVALNINTLATAATLNGAAFDYGLVGNVPEPSTWALMLLGFAGLGFAGYRGAKPTSIKPTSIKPTSAKSEFGAI